MNPSNSFWRLQRVTEEVGLQKTSIYKMISEKNFPLPKSYPGNRGVFWLSGEIEAWKTAVIENQPQVDMSMMADLG